MERRGRVESSWLLALAMSAGCATVTLPSPAPERSLLDRCQDLHADAASCVEGPVGIVGVKSGHAFFWVVPVEEGLVLVDAGYGREGRELRHLCAGHRVHAILLTHGHTDHWAGAHVLSSVPVYVGRRDLPRMRREAGSKGCLPRLGEILIPAPPLPRRLVPVDDGFTLDLGGRRFRAIGVPGHTGGSLAWTSGNTLFGGDALLGDGKGGVGIAPGLFSDDVEGSRTSLQQLLPLSASVLLDGHAGRTDDLATALEAFQNSEEGR